MKAIAGALMGSGLALFQIAAGAGEAPQKPMQLDIKPQPLVDALNEWAQQTGFQLIYPEVDAATQRMVVPALKGAYTTQEAMNRLLTGTSLTYEFVNRRTVSIRERQRHPMASILVAPDLNESAPQFQRLAAVETVTGDSPAPVPAVAATGAQVQAAHSKVAAPVETLDEVIVTGSNIRGTDSITPVLGISAVDIAETGYATAQDWIDTLPQNFGSLQNEENTIQGNFNRGTGVNLRGLGSGATLVLVNGRRQPVSGTEGDFVDISSLPTSAIERVEILTDGASAVYGSDAIGGVVNFILRKDFNGAETSLRRSSADGSAEEALFAQLFGLAWQSGRAMFDYQYYKRSALSYGDRSYMASADKRPLGGDDLRSPNSNPGNFIIGGVPTFAIPSNQDGTALTPGDLLPGVVNLDEPLAGAAALPSRDMHSGFVALSQDVGDNLELFLEGRYTKRKVSYDLAAPASPLFVTAANPFFVSPDGAPFAIIGYNFSDDYGPFLAQGDTQTYLGVAGATLDFASDWKGTLSVSGGKEDMQWALPQVDFFAMLAALEDPDPATAFNPFGDGSHTNPATLERMLSTTNVEGTSGLEVVNLIADGSLFSLPAGSVKLAVGGDYRTEDLERETQVIRRKHYERSISAAFAEVVVPLLGAGTTSSSPLIELSAAGRYETYSDFGSTFNPKFGIRYRPWESVSLRASWGSSFKAPLLVDLDEVSKPQNDTYLSFLPDPQSTAGISSVLLRTGGSSQLEEETADTWTAGVDFSLPHGFTATLTYYQTDYDNRIVRPGTLLPSDLLFQEEQWASIVTRNPSPEQIAVVCNDPALSVPIVTCLASTPAVIVDFRKRNLAETHMRGIDVVIEQLIQTGFGNIGLSFNGTYILENEIVAAPSAPAIDVRDTINYPSSLRLRSTGSWGYRGWGASLSLNYTGGYDDDVRGQRSVDAWTTLDARITYATPDAQGWLGGVELSLSAANVLNGDPPFVNNLLGYDPANASPLGRVVALQLKKNW